MYLQKSNVYNKDVEYVQRLLNSALQLEAYRGKWPRLSIDGYYGDNTEKAVKAFQYYHNPRIQQTGIVGDTTLRSLQNSGPSLYTAPPKTYLSAPSLKKQPVAQPKSISLTEIFDKIAREVIKPFADVLKSSSDEAAKQLKRLQAAKLTTADIDRVAKSIFQRTQVQQMRQVIQREVFDRLQALARGNTNKLNYKSNGQTLNEWWQVSSAQKQLSKGRLNAQNMSMVNKTLLKQLTDKCMKELESAHFEKIIVDRMGKVGQYAPKTGGVLLQALALLPIMIDTVVLFYKLFKGEPTDEALKKLISDWISFIVGTLIGIVISAIVAAAGLTGGVAVLVVVVVGVVVGVILQLVFPGWEEGLADKVLGWLKRMFEAVGNGMVALQKQVGKVVPIVSANLK